MSDEDFYKHAQSGYNGSTLNPKTHLGIMAEGFGNYKRVLDEEEARKKTSAQIAAAVSSDASCNPDELKRTERAEATSLKGVGIAALTLSTLGAAALAYKYNLFPSVVKVGATVAIAGTAHAINRICGVRPQDSFTSIAGGAAIATVMDMNDRADFVPTFLKATAGIMVARPALEWGLNNPGKAFAAVATTAALYWGGMKMVPAQDTAKPHPPALMGNSQIKTPPLRTF